ncbi:DUF3631 domain-containing protein [Streptomyces sp. NBC_01537]|uniref:DUF3631 domain-containing protein n=1 Tax=Streptomyces sp. NBC_01537 TaxID=2903896 RepID=UPI00386ED4A1
MTTTFPTLLDTLAATVLDTEPPKENPHHRALLDTFVEIQHLDQQLLDLAGADRPAGASAVEQLEQLTDLIVERLAAGHELTRLLSTACCCTGTGTGTGTGTDAEDGDGDGDGDGAEDLLFCPSGRRQTGSIVQACLEVFADLGDEDAVASADLVAVLRHLPGVAEGRWRYAELTQARLAQLLAPYEVSTRDVTLPDGRRRKSYRRGALLAALQSCSC